MLVFRGSQNIDIDDVRKYIELDETTYIKMIRTSKGRYFAETNYWLIEYYLRGSVFKYPNEFYNVHNYDERFRDRFGQIAADGSTSGIYVDFFIQEQELFYIALNGIIVKYGTTLKKKNRFIF